MRKSKWKQKGMIIIIGMAGLFIAKSVLAEYTSYKTQIIEKKVDINVYEYQLLMEKVKEKEEQIKSAQDRLSLAEQEKKEAEANSDPLGVLRAEALIKSAKEEIKSLNESLTEVTLQAELNYYYEENKDVIIAKEKAVESYQHYSNRQKLVQQSFYMIYLESLKLELEKKLYQEEEKFKLGYTTSLVLEEARYNLKEVNLKIENAKDEEAYTKEILTRNGETVENKDSDTSLSALNSNYLDLFFSSSTEMKYIDQQVQAYGNYQTSTSISEKAREKAKMQTDLLILQKNQYKLDLELYVKNLELKHTLISRDILNLEEKVKLTQQKLNDTQLLFTQGKLTEEKLLEIKTELSKLEYDRMGLIIEGNSIFYILENQIENQNI